MMPLTTADLAKWMSDNPDLSAANTIAPAPSAGEELFVTIWRATNGPALEREYRFDPDRRWRADFAHLASRTLIEIEGGTWSNGRHNRGQGYQADCEKYLAANLAGWEVLRLTTEMVTHDNLTAILNHIKNKLSV